MSSKKPSSDFPPGAGVGATEGEEELRRRREHSDYKTAEQNLKSFRKSQERADFLRAMAESLGGFSEEKRSVWQQFLDDHRRESPPATTAVAGRKKERVKKAGRTNASAAEATLPEEEKAVAATEPAVPAGESAIAKKLRESGVAERIKRTEEENQELRNQEKYKELQAAYEQVKSGDANSGFKDLSAFFDSIQEVLDALTEEESLEYKITELFLKDHAKEIETLKSSSTPEPVADLSTVGKSSVGKTEKKTTTAREIGHLPDLAEYRRRWLEMFPKLAVRGGSGGERISNVDGNACLFLFRKILGFASGTESERAYVDPRNIEYLKPGQVAAGAMNLDTSDHVHGGLAERATGYVDHHGKESPRQSSAFKILYEFFKDSKILPEMKEADEFAVERLVQFVTYVDSYTLPKKGERGFDRTLNWKDTWADAHRTVFGITLSYQNETPIEDLYEFFKRHTMAEAFTLAVDGSTEPYLKKIRELGQRLYEEGKMNKERKETTEDFLQRVDQDKEHQRMAVDTVLGRIVVYIQDRPERRLPALQMAALAHGYDGTLVWRPHNNSFVIGVGPHKKITDEIVQKVGAGELVREAQLIVPSSKEPVISLKDLLERLGTDISKLDAKSRLGKEAGVSPVEIKTSAATAAASAPIEALKPEEKQPEPREAWHPKFEVGDLVITKEVKGVKKFTEPKKIIKSANISGTNYYALEGEETKRWHREEWLEKSIAPASVPPEAGARTTPEPAPTPVEVPFKTPAPEISPVPSSALRVEVPAPTAAESEINVERAETDFNACRQAYINVYKEFLETKKESSVSKTWWQRNIVERFRSKEKNEATDETNPYLAEVKEKLDIAREKYLQAKQEYAKVLYQKKARELAREGKSAEEIARELEIFGYEEIFQKLIVGEERALQEQCVADWPPKEKSLWRRAFEKWAKLPTGVRVLISTSAVVGAVAATGGFAAVGLTGAALFAGSRYARGLASVGLAKAAGWGVEKIGGKIIEKKTKATQEEIDREFAEAMRDGHTDVLGTLSEKYHQMFEKKAKMERYKLLAKIGASLSVGVGAAYGLGMLERGLTGGNAAETAQPAAEIAEQQRALADLQRQTDEAIASAKAKGQSLVEAVRQKAEQATELAQRQAELTHTYDLATINKGEGVIHVLRRQLEDDPARFGFSGDARDPQAVHAWADHEATQISIKEHYWDPKTGDQNWVRFNPKAPMRFVLEGDAQHGFKVQEMGTEGRHFIHHQTEGEKMLMNERRAKLDWNEEAPSARPAATLSGDAARIAHGVDEAVSRVTTDQIPTDTGIHLSGGQEIAIKDLKMSADVPDKGFTRLADIGYKHLDAPEGYRWADIAKGHAALLDAKVQAAHELAEQYASADPNVAAAARAVEQDALVEAQQFASKVRSGIALTGQDALVLKPDVTESAYRGSMVRHLNDEVWRRSVSLGAEAVSPMDVGKGAFKVIFENHGGNLEPVIKPQTGANSFLDNLHQDQTRGGLLRAGLVGEVPAAKMVDNMSVLNKALQKLVESGQETSEAAKSLKKALRDMAKHVAGHASKPVTDFFDSRWLKSVE